MTRMEIDYSKSAEFLEALKKAPNVTEASLNDFLRKKGTKTVKSSIYDRMPVSDRKKVHAKDATSLTHRMGNLSFVVRAKGGAANKKNSFGYLVFPNEGIGRNNRIAQRFFETGLENADEPLRSELLDVIVESL